MEDKNIKSPFVEKIEFDYNKLRDEVTVPAIKEIFKVLSDNSDLLVHGTQATPDIIQEGLATLSAKIKDVLIGRKIPNGDMQFLLNNFNHISDMFTMILKQKNDAERELLTLAVGGKNPGTGDPSLEYATLGDLFESLVEKRK